VRTVPWSPRRIVVVPLAVAMLAVPASAATAQDSTIPENGAGVSTTPPVPLPGERATPATAADLPNTGSDPRMLFLTGLAMSLLGAGLRLRTVDADDY
jgi:LPXTG-motif cell wall-anchored protein